MFHKGCQNLSIQEKRALMLQMPRKNCQKGRMVKSKERPLFIQDLCKQIKIVHDVNIKGH